MKSHLMLLLVLALGLTSTNLEAQRKRKKDEQTEAKKEKHAIDKVSLSNLKFRSIGPALTSGRISDIAVNPNWNQEYYVATSSGGVWKTVNAGTTFKPIFDSQGSYSIGCVTMDPSNTSTIWVGT